MKNMLSINTNFSNLIVQESMRSATSKLNQAIERMSTGYRINHAKDNAANYSISTDMTTKMSAYQVAEDNISMGMDLVSTAGDILSQMQDHASRIKALVIQSRNNTYGAQSLQAIQSEANARLAEITRLYLSSEYNGTALFNRRANNIPQSGTSGFIDDTAVNIKPRYNGFIENPKTYDDSVVDKMTSINSFTDGANGNFKITSAEDLAKLAYFVNTEGFDTSNATFYLAKDIDMEEWCTNNTWEPIGCTYPNCFKGTFDGNGHSIKNLKINGSIGDFQALFGNTESSNIKNLGIENINISTNAGASGLIGFINSDVEISNCYVTGNIKGNKFAGGLVAHCNASLYMESCYSEAKITSTDIIAGGLIGECYDAELTNCYATGNITGNDRVGGLIGTSSQTELTNCYATGNATGSDRVAGLIGNCYFTELTNCYATGNVTGNRDVGGLIGLYVNYDSTKNLKSCYSLGTVTGNSRTGSFIGAVINTSNGTGFGTTNISNCYAPKYENMDFISGCYRYSNGVENTNRLDAMLGGIATVQKFKTSTTLQIGIHSNNNSQIDFTTSFQYDLSTIEADISTTESLSAINDFINMLSNKQTEIGAVSNRLESVLEEVSILYENLASSRSTIRDADMAELSSTYIQQQILQQASATLMATTNQTPSIALQLI